MAPDEIPSNQPASVEPAALTHAMAALRARFRLSAFWFVVRTGVLIWLGDVLWLFHDRPEYPKPATQGVFAALCLGLIVFGIAGVGLQVAWSLGSAGGAARSFTRLRTWLSERGAPDALESAASLLALPLVLAVYAAGTFLMSRRIVLGMARPEFAALALVGAQLALLSASILAFWPARAFARLAARPLVRAPVFRRPIAIVWLLGALACVALGTFGWLYREPLGYLPWRQILQVGLALGASLALGLLVQGRAVSWALRAAAIGCGVAGVVAAVSLPAASGYARRIAEQSSLTGTLAYSVLRSAFDRDRDGYLSLLGGGDCAPSDPKRNPGATDVPGNKIDEDCDGVDLDPSVLAPRGRYDFAVPDAIPRTPPIILLTIDAFAADRMKQLGGARGVTPNLDKLAERSVFFTSAYAQGPSTRLSFPSMFTSRWDSQIRQQLVGRHPFPIDASETMLADLLRAAGYDTVAVLGDGYFTSRRWQGITRGFTHVVNSALPANDKEHNGPRVTEAVLAELRMQRDRPLFLWAHYYDAHSPHVQPSDVKVYGTERADVYDAELTLVDREVGRLIATIDEIWRGQALVIVTADHGIAFDVPRHEKFNYGYDLYSSVLHVPLLFHAGFLKPRRLGGVVSTMDIMPTLLNLVRVPQVFVLEGTSLMPELLRGERSRPPEVMHQMFLEERLWKQEEPLERVALRTDRFALLQDRRSGYFELYDYRKDYFETRDLSVDPAYEVELQKLKRQLSLLVYVAQKDGMLEKARGSRAKNKASP